MIERWDNEEPGEGGIGTFAIAGVFLLALLAALATAAYYLI